MFALSQKSCPAIRRPFAQMALAIGMLSSVVACGQSALHPSFGQRFAAAQAAQLAAHPSKEPVVRGDEAARTIGTYYGTLEGTAQGGGAPAGGGSQGAGMQTAGVPPLH